MKTVGQIIREKRLERNWSLTQLAMKIGADRSTISKWENDHNSPTLYFVEELMRVFGCTLNELYGYE